MILTLSDGREIEVKAISIDYKRMNDPVYSGDCVAYLHNVDTFEAAQDVLDAINLALEVDCGLAEYPEPVVEEEEVIE